MTCANLIRACSTLSLISSGMVIQVSAMDAYIVGPRALGMGGTGVASSNDYTAQFYNPALFGFFGSASANDNQGLANKSWGFGLDASAGARVHGDLLETAKALANTNLQGLSQNGITSQADIQQLVAVARELGTVDDPGNAVSADATAGVSVRIGHAALGVRVFGQAATLVSNADLVNVALGAAGPALGNQLAQNGTSDNQVLLFSTAQRDSLYTALGGTGAFGTDANATAAVRNLDYQMRQSGITASQVDAVVTVIQNAAQTNGAKLEQNDTVVRLRGFGVVEVPLSYGWALDQHWSIGGSLKLMIGRVYGTQISVFKENAAEQVDQTLENYNTTVTWGLDLAVAGRWEWFQAGAVGRNLNSPKFDGFTDPFGIVVDGVRVDPQVAVGVAFIPRSWITLALDADLLPGHSSFSGYDTQRVGAGIEINPWNVLALRAGVYKNIAESDIGPVVTLGAGLNLWAVRIDLAVAATTHTTNVLGYDLPDELRGSFGLTVDF